MSDGLQCAGHKAPPLCSRRLRPVAAPVLPFSHHTGALLHRLSPSGPTQSISHFVISGVVFGLNGARVLSKFKLHASIIMHHDVVIYIKYLKQQWKTGGCNHVMVMLFPDFSLLAFFLSVFQA